MPNRCLNIFSIATVVLYSSCAVRSIYIPLTQNVPLFDTAKQIKAAGFIGANHAEFQLAHNPINHVAFAGNVYYGAGMSCYDLAVGSYFFDDACKWRYEVFGGYGYNVNSNYGSNPFSIGQNVSYDIHSLYHRLYVQPALGFAGRIPIYKISYSFSLSLRLSYLRFEDYLFREKDNDAPGTVYIVDKEYHNMDLYTIEPCITNKVGIGNLYAVLQVQTTSPYSKQIDVSNTKFSPGFSYSAGIQYNLNFKKRKR